MLQTAPNHTTPRRDLLGLVPFALAASGPAIAASSVGVQSRDAELIEVCQRFAEAELTGWYRWLTAPDNAADQQAADDMWVIDWGTWDWIAATPAMTPEGWHAKALAFVAMNRNAYDDAEDRDTNTPVLASLLRDIVRPARAAIIARLTRLYGLPPAGYTADGMWMSAEARA